MNRRTFLPTSLALACFAAAAQAEESQVYDFGGRMGIYHQSYILEKTPGPADGKFSVKTRRVETTGRVKTQDNEVDCDPTNPSVSGAWGRYEGKVFDEDYEVSGASESVYNLLWAVCRGETLKSLDGTQIYEGYPVVPVARDEVKGRTYDLYILAQDVVSDFWAVRKVTLEYRLGEVRARKTAHVFCDFRLPTLTVDGKTHELADTLFVENPAADRKLGTWEHVWIAACIGRTRFEPAN